MAINTDHLKYCLSVHESSLSFYRKVEPGNIKQDVFRNSILTDMECARLPAGFHREIERAHVVVQEA